MVLTLPKPFPPRSKELYCIYVCLYFIISNTETIVKAGRIFGVELKRGSEGATPWPLLWGYHVCHLKVKVGGTCNEKEVYKEPIKSLSETTKNVKKEMKAHK